MKGIFQDRAIVQIRASDPVSAMRVPSAENATLQTGPVCPLRVRSSTPLAAFHTFAVGTTPQGVVAADLNGDGRPDLAVW